jgi:formylglycine-generating enzyme required for sulfatase activity
MTLATSPNLARIPAGDFLMGASDFEQDERPVHRVFVSEFFISRFAVTQDEYARFVRETGYPVPSIRGLPMVTLGGRDTLFRELATPYVWQDSHPPAGRGSHPVVLARYDDAQAYCRWLSESLGRVVRLPTEAEWEKAARGGLEGQRYPWGSTIDPVQCNYLVDASISGSAARVRPAPIPPTCTALRHGGERLGMGVRLVPRITMGWERCATRRGRRSAPCGSSAVRG